MANLDATQWLDLQSTNTTSDSRYAELGVLDAVKASTPATSEYIRPSDAANLSSMSNLRDLQLPVIKEYTPTVVTTPGFSMIPSNLQETDQYTFVAYDVFSGMRHYPASFRNNAVDEQFAIKENMRRISYEMGKTVESILLSNLSARKSQVLANTTQVSFGTGTYSFNTGTDTLEINKAAQDETMFYSLEGLMASNELGGNYRIVTNRAGLARQKAEIAKYGMYNSKNIENLGFFDPSRMHESASISAGSDIFNGYLLRDGSIGVYENFPYDFAMGTNFAGKTWSVSDTEIENVKMRCNIYVNNEATDATSIITTGNDINLKMTHFQETAIWARFYVVYRYNSSIGTRAQDIVKIQGLAS
jgi:hypothetical protein